MSFHSLSREYLKDLEGVFQTARTGEATAELSYRPALDNFFRQLKEHFLPSEVEAIFEPRTQNKAGRPDWRFYNKANLGVYGFIEAKGLDTSSVINPSVNASQIERYLELKQNLILTDGIDFVFYLANDNWRPKIISLVQKPLTSEGWDRLTPNPLLENSFRDFFESPLPRECTEEQLISGVAQRAARLSEEVRGLVDLDPEAALSDRERAIIEKLRSLSRYLQSNHDPSLAESRPFADFVAQVLCFGLLYSHRSDQQAVSSAADRYFRIHNFWIEGLAGAVAPLRPFQELILQLKDELEPHAGSESALSTWYDDCRHLLSYVQLTSDQVNAPDFHRLYESFLEKFDPRARFDFGAFYTPKELASFVIMVADQITHRVFKESLFASDNKLIDPCCGTGTFIEQILKKLSKGQTPQVIGFEILPAPYALAHYRLSINPDLQEFVQSHVHILLTNTLSDQLNLPVEAVDDEINRFNEEQIDARKYARPPIIAVMGNPPSSDSTKAPHQQAAIYSHITQLVDDFRPPVDVRGPRQNTQKQLRNDFVRFLRWSADRVASGERGIMALVVPESLLEHGSYRFARKWLIENFRFIWALDIDADQRSGASTYSLFRTLQGRALLIAVRDDTQPSGLPAQIRYGSIRDLTLKEKNEFLSKSVTDHELDEIFDQEVELDSLHRFRPGNAYDQELWKHCWPIYYSGSNSQLVAGDHSIFIRHSSSLKLGATSLLVHSSPMILVRRTGEISREGASFERIREQWFSGQSKPPSEQKLGVLTPALRKAAARKSTSRYLHRPFVNLYAILDEDVLTALSTMPGGGARPRPEVRSAFAVPNNLAFTIAPSRRDIGDDLHRFVSFCWGIPDNDLCRRGNSQVVSVLFPEYKPTKGEWDPQPVANFDPLLIESIPIVEELTREHSLVYYAYAILCSPVYLEEFSGVLFTTAAADTIPRLPIVQDPELYSQVALIGKRLAELESPDCVLDLSGVRQGLLTAYLDDDFRKLHGVSRLSQEDGKIVLSLIDPEGAILFSTDAIDPSVANFRVSGYTVIDEWVKWFSYRYARTPLRKQTVEAFIQLVSRVEKQLEEVSTLDVLVEKILENPNAWLKCPQR